MWEAGRQPRCRRSHREERFPLLRSYRLLPAGTLGVGEPSGYARCAPTSTGVLCFPSRTLSREKEGSQPSGCPSSPSGSEGGQPPVPQEERCEREGMENRDVPVPKVQGCHLLAGRANCALK